MLIVGFGGTVRDASSSETALRIALRSASEAGAEAALFTGSDLGFPMYDPSHNARTRPSSQFISAISAADGYIVSSPAYHGTISGLIKNAFDYIEDLATSRPPYLDDRPVGCIAVGYGSQAPSYTLSTLRTIVHSLRGWPTPYGAAINVKSEVLTDGEDPDWSHPGLCLVGRQVMDFASRPLRNKKVETTHVR